MVSKISVYVTLALLLTTLPYGVVAADSFTANQVPTAEHNFTNASDCVHQDSTRGRTVNVSANRTNDDRIRLTFHLSNQSVWEDGEISLELPPSVENLSVSGFYDFSSIITWKGEDFTPQAEYSFNTSNSTLSSQRLSTFGTGDSWALAPLPYSDFYDLSLNNTGGFILGDLLYLGNYTTERSANGCHGIEIRRPEAATYDSTARELTSRLEEIDHHLEFGHRYATVTGISHPRRISPLGGWASGNYFVATRTGPFYTTPVHEYIHTRQANYQDSGLGWLSEASAVYYELRASLRAGHISGPEYNLAISGIYDQLSTENEGWYKSPRKQEWYTRGAIVVARLDQQIRAATDGNQSFDDVMHSVNQAARDGSLSPEKFRSIIRRIGGESVASSSERYILEGQLPERPTLREPNRLSTYAWLALSGYTGSPKWNILVFASGIALSITSNRVIQKYQSWRGQ